MLFLGSSVLNADGSISLTAPAGFASVNGVRLTNYTTSVLILRDINPSNPSNQYLLPGMQTVYRTVNRSRYPRLEDISTGLIDAVTGLLVEWTTDFEDDFKGLQYPVMVNNASVQAATADIYLLPMVDHLEVYSVAGSEQRTRLWVYNPTAFPIRWSSEDYDWPNRPQIPPGESREIISNNPIFFTGDVDNLVLEVVEETLPTIDLSLE